VLFGPQKVWEQTSCAAQSVWLLHALGMAVQLATFGAQ
jgi:hypothetical protein